jgi:hypothetical protein
MAELKTKMTEASVEGFLASIEDEKKRRDSFTLLEIFSRATGTQPKMWGSSIVGFGEYHYKYASGHEGDMCKIGFSPRKQALTLYLMQDRTKFQHLLPALGKFKSGVGCLYIKKLEDVDVAVLEQMIRLSYTG